MSTENLSERIAATAWGEAFLREMDLTIAANVFASLRGQERAGTLYNHDLDLRVAERVRPLDPEVEDVFLGVHRIEPNPAEPWKEVEDATDFLKERPRGTWAVFQHPSGGYEAFMSDGFGNLAQTYGNSFMYTSPTAPSLCFEELYASVWGTTDYHRREAIGREISRESARNLPEAGAVATDVHLKQRKWAKVVFEGVVADVHSDPVPFQISATRPGVRKTAFRTTAESIHSIFKMPHAMPERYVDPANEDRLATLHERRVDAAREALGPVLVRIDDLAPGKNDGKLYYFRRDGDVYRHPVYLVGDVVPDASAKAVVEFAPGSAEVLSTQVERPAPGLTR